MPVYVYKDAHTGEIFAREQRIIDAPLRINPLTGNPVVRVPQAPTIRFNGPGFAINDLARSWPDERTPRGDQ